MFSGRITRLSYLMAGVYAAVVYLAMALIMASISKDSSLYAILSVIFVLVYLAIIVVGFSAAVRRLHDLGQSGWMSLLLLVPLVNIVLGFYLLFARTNEEKAAQYAPTAYRGYDALKIYGLKA